MHIIHKMAQHQQRKIQKHIKTSNSCRFFNQLTSPELLATVDDLLPEHRERYYPPTETLSMFLAQALNADRSCQYAVNHALVQRVTHGLPALSVSTGAYCRARKRLPLGMITQLVHTIVDQFTANDVIVGDAFFGTYFLLAALQHKHVNAVFEQMGARKRVTDFRRGQRLGTKDHLITLTKPKKKPDWMTQDAYECAPKTLTIREVKINGKILITTFLSTQEATRDELKTLYKKRWNIEVDFRSLKTTMGMDVLSCKTPDMIEKEIWVYFLAYNLIRLHMARKRPTNPTFLP